MNKRLGRWEYRHLPSLHAALFGGGQNLPRHYSVEVQDASGRLTVTKRKLACRNRIRAAKWPERVVVRRFWTRSKCQTCHQRRSHTSACFSSSAVYFACIAVLRSGWEHVPRNEQPGSQKRSRNRLGLEQYHATSLIAVMRPTPPP